MTHQHDYHYHNFSLDHLPGELWKDVPGLEGYYRISNLGRICRLEWEGKNKRGYYHFKPAMMIKPIERRNWNAFVKDYRKSLSVVLVKEKKLHNFSLARLVYFCFNEEFDLSNKNLYILAKDGDPLNVSSENLILGTSKDKNAKMEAAGRRAAPFKKLTSENRKQIQEKINAIKEEKGVYRISRYSLSGKLLETYPNAKVAAAAMKTSQGHLSAAARGKSKDSGSLVTACGYLWRRGAPAEIDVQALIENKSLGASPLISQQKRMGQYDFTGKLINTFSTIKEAARIVKVHPGSIQRAITGKRMSCGGFLWRRGTKAKIQVKHLTQSASFNSRLSPELTQVSQYDLDGKWIKTYATAAIAARTTKVDESDIYRVVKDKAVSAGGFLWRSGSNLRIDINALRKHPHFKRSGLEKHMKKKRERSLLEMAQKD